jgi:hypothetical protein
MVQGEAGERKAVVAKQKKDGLEEPSLIWRRHPDLNRGIAVLQTAALPLGYAAIKQVRG